MAILLNSFISYFLYPLKKFRYLLIKAFYVVFCFVKSLNIQLLIFSP
jgi:hypothetical protein